MRIARFLPAVCLVAALGAAPAQAAVAVNFVDPDHYSDAAAYRGKAPAPQLEALRQHLVALGGRYLRPGQTLTVDVLDLDLAGEVEWWRPNAYDLRIMRDVTPPRIKLRYSLAEDGRTVGQGEEVLTDPAYLSQADLQRSGDPLRYEKAMLERWFHARFGQDGRARG